MYVRTIQLATPSLPPSLVRDVGSRVTCGRIVLTTFQERGVDFEGSDLCDSIENVFSWRGNDS